MILYRTMSEQQKENKHIFGRVENGIPMIRLAIGFFWLWHTG